MKTLALSCAALLAVSVPTADAQNIGAKAAAKEKTNVTFSGPVRVPGKILPAGEYTFQLANPMFADRQTVEIWKKDGEKIATFLTVPISRPQDSNELVLMFNTSTAPPAVKGWFYPQNDEGHAFVYSREEAREIARLASEPVPAADLPGSFETPVMVTVITIDPKGAEGAFASPNEAPAAQASGQTRPQTQPRQQPTATAQGAAHTTLQGCVYRERDIPGRTPNPAERAGVLEDYILVTSNDTSAAGAQATGTSGTVGTTGTARAGMSAGSMFKLEEISDDRLRAVVGKRVEVTGRADIEQGDMKRSGQAGAAAQDRSLGPDRIELPEFEVTSIREVAGTCPSTPQVGK